ncbi:uncharacterized protein MEPE_04322 [Melanopsichium pennsylvanicum]|uniref:Uncharacterized protein n=2 Tax=Melanopsichium pennsylvanicum TaxID=63383 RepID=A0AAJ4XR80_9BASI|nr:putative protein [Melanopsichium pennsylvanicum 4]SNX85613.1 uncharacterized protein MEPE_04322 [Melanopsichium pennsylvanicum]
MINPFRKRQQRKAAAAAQASPSSPIPTDYSALPSTSKLPPRPGIFIASASAVPRAPSFVERQKAAAAARQQSLDHVLPPASDYRQSLIMPHLTRRFTLLRAPDGSLVSPDAMRAHLRAQRARARAANIGVGSGLTNHVHFLTEDEENEIIEQLKAQARAEGRDFDLEQSATAAAVDSWRNGYAAGTDGFGSWGPAPSNNSNKLTSLAETLGDLSSIGHGSISADSPSSAWSPARKAGGSLFTGRSAERDQAYFRRAKSERKTSRTEDSPPSHRGESAGEVFQKSTIDTAARDSFVHSQETPRQESNHNDDSQMPGGFVAAHSSADSHLIPVAQQDQGPTTKGASLNIPGLNDPSRLRTSQDSNLLTNLSPEAFKRVSTALDEVFGLIASERGSSPGRVAPRSPNDPHHTAQRSSVDSDTNSFASAVSHVRAGQVDSPVTVARTGAHDAGFAEEDERDGDKSADCTITGPQPTLDAVHIEEGRFALPSPNTLPGSLPGAHLDLVPEMLASETATQLPSLLSSDSAMTVMNGNRSDEPSQAGATLAPAVASTQHLSVSGRSLADSTLTRPSDRSSTATATEVPQQASRIVSTASTVEAPQVGHAQPSTSANESVSELTALGTEVDQRSYDEMPPPPALNDRRSQLQQPDRTPDMTSHTNGFFASNARSNFSRGDSIVSGSSMRSSLTNPSATHSRKSSADKLALARSMAPHPNLREQPSLSSIRRNYRQHARSQTGSSEGSLLGTSFSRRSSGAMSPAPVLSRSARSPNYFPPPSSNVSIHDYASGFKPPSAISPAATAALQSMANQSPQPVQTSVMDASNALRSVQSMRNSASTGQSVVSPLVPSYAAFTSGSERAAATSSPDTNGTSVSLQHHQRNASLIGSAKQQIPAGEDHRFSPSMYAPRPAPLPQPSQGVSTMNESNLTPSAPSDPEQAEKWRAMYGIKAADAASLRTSAEDVSAADPIDEEDLWARMAIPPEPDVERPVSNWPPSAAERLEGTGLTFDQIALFHDRLIQTANGHGENEIVPPLPRIMADQNGCRQSENKFAEAKSKGLASPNVVLGAGSEWATPPAVAKSVPQTGDGLAFAGGSNGNTPVHDASLRRNPSSNLSQDPSLSPRAVMYDVTTSHRPTSPPLHSRNGSLSGLPSLLELNGTSSLGHRNNRESFSLSRAVEEASRLPRHPAFKSSSIAEDPSNDGLDQDQYATSTVPVQEHPFNIGYVSPSTGNNFTFPLRDGGIGDSPRSPVQNLEQHADDVWNRYAPGHGGITPDPFNSPSAHTDSTRLMDDIAAQTSAATRALKGTDDGSVPTPPFRTKSISRKKSFKKVSKQISSPQLISTSQKLDHTTQLPNLQETPAEAKVKRSTRSPGWGSIGGAMGIDPSREHNKVSPSGTSRSGSVSKGSGYFHRRRSSSFGHEASPGENFGTDVQPSVSSNGADRTHPNNPYMNGGANGGSLSRLFSKIKSRKHSEATFGGATIEPFPAELTAQANARAVESSMPPPPVPQHAPAMSPSTPTMPHVQRKAPWTLPQIPSSVGSISERASSLRSPTSPAYTLPIDSTSMPKNKSGKKKRNPIVLKPESEVILPGDLNYMPLAVTGRSPEESSKELQAEITEGSQEISSPAYLPEKEQQDLQGLSTDMTLGEGTDERMDYCQSPNSGALAPVAAQDDEESVTPRPAFSTSAEAVQLAQDGSQMVNSADTAVPAALAADVADPDSLSEVSPVSNQALPNAKESRKSLRDTIVRRTIIIPAGIDFSQDQRRSLFGSSRKSRRFATVEDEPIPTPTSSPVSPAVKDTASLPADYTSASSALGEAEPTTMSTMISTQTLRPDSSAAGGDKSNRASRVESSYAGSLYDYYIGGGEGIEFNSLSSETKNISRRSILARASRMPSEPRRHIEVTERADGSVVWQVIAGLADRGSVYSDFNPRHTRTFSDASGVGVPNGEGEGTDEDDDEDILKHGGLFRTPAGLTDDDSRSFFTRPRGGGGQHRKSFSFDKSQPLPDLPRSGGSRQDVFEIANQPVDGSDPLSPSSGNASWGNGEGQFSIGDGDRDRVANPTRIVYHNDAQLASLLNVLARGKDSAKFEFQIAPPSGDGEMASDTGSNAFPRAGAHGAFGADGADAIWQGGEYRSSNTWTKNEVFDADDIESHRSRVEAEIYTLLNQQALIGRSADHHHHLMSPVRDQVQVDVDNTF